MNWSGDIDCQEELRAERAKHPEYARPFQVTCPGCKREWLTRSFSRSYCTEACRLKARQDYRREQAALKRKMQCKVCSNWFQAARKDSVFCSGVCRQKNYRLTHRYGS